MKTIFSAILFSIFLVSNAQDLDSILNASQLLKSDTERVQLFYKEGFKYRAVDPFYSYECAELAERHAVKSGHPYYKAKAYNLKGILFYRKGELPKSVQYHKQALELRIRINDKDGIVKSNINLANVLGDLGMFLAAENSYLEAYETCSETGNQIQAANCLMNLGVLFANVSSLQTDSLMYLKAEDYLSRAYKFARSMNDHELQAEILNNQAVLALIRQDHESAFAYCMDALKLYDLMENEAMKADVYLNLSLAYVRSNQADSAEKNLQRADRIIQLFHLLGAKSNWYLISARSFALKKDFENAYYCSSRHKTLSDSLQRSSNAIKSEYLLLGATNISKEKPAKFEFPYLYFNILLITVLTCVFLIFKNSK